MRVLLDECLPRKLKGAFADHACETVPEAGLAGTKNGQLLSRAEVLGFEIFVTMDKSLRYQQNLSGRRISIIVLRSPSNRLVDLLPLMPACLAAMPLAQPGDVTRI